MNQFKRTRMRWSIMLTNWAVIYPTDGTAAKSIGLIATSIRFEYLTPLTQNRSVLHLPACRSPRQNFDMRRD
jgi:hypothetical protein